MRHSHWLRLLAAISVILLALPAGGLGQAGARAATYVVRPNDTLSGIAVAFGTTTSALVAANNLSSADGIRVGQVLLIQGDGGGRGHGHDWHDREHRATASPTAVGVVAADADTGLAARTYLVRPGDTLSEIAQRFGVSQGALAEANAGAALSPLRVGQRLSVPVPGAVVTQPSPLPNQDSNSGPVVTPTVSPGSPGVPATAIPAQGQAGQTGAIAALLAAQAQAAGVSVALVKAVAWQESGWRMVTASDGGMGVMQLMPATVDWLSTALLGYRIDPSNASDNIRGGVALLRYYLGIFGGDQRLAIAAYHQGLSGVQHQGISTATAGYVASVLALEQRFTA